MGGWACGQRWEWGGCVGNVAGGVGWWVSGYRVDDATGLGATPSSVTFRAQGKRTAVRVVTSLAVVI